MLYALKMWMFRGQFQITKKETQGLMRIAVFAARVYVRFLTEAPLAAEAPLNDLALLKTLSTYGESTVCLRIIAISARRQYRSTRSGLSGTGGGRGWVTPGRVSSGEA